MWQNSIKHVDTNASMTRINLMNNTLGAPDPQVMSSTTCSLLVVQFDPTFHPDNIITAGVIVNVFPTSIGPIGVQRQLGTTETKTRSAQYTGLLLHNEAIVVAAKEYCRSLNLHKRYYGTNYTMPTNLVID